MRRAVLAAVFLLLLCVLAVQLFLRARLPIASFGDCKDRGYPVQEKFPEACTDGAGTVFLADDRATYLHPSLPVAFSYPGTLVRSKGQKPVMDVLSGSAGMLEVLRIEGEGEIGDIAKSLLPVAASGGLNVIRARLGTVEYAVTLFPSRGTGAALLLVPVSDETFVGVRGTQALIQKAVSSFVFLDHPPVFGRFLGGW